jgi:hypothetical protein
MALRPTTIAVAARSGSVEFAVVFVPRIACRSGAEAVEIRVPIL